MTQIILAKEKMKIKLDWLITIKFRSLGWFPSEILLKP